MANRTKWAVDIIESERGWGQRLDETKKFASYKAAKDFQLQYNKKYNTQKTVPDWYMYADHPYEVEK